MATRDDVVVDFEASPRIAIVDTPSVEFQVQDIVDTLRKREDTFRGQSETKLINASGKEDLGGGVSVGITAELQDTQVAFEGRTTPAQTGTVTTASGPPVGDSPPRKLGIIQLIDINATFQSNNVQRGSLVINFTDGSIAEVYRVDTETTLFTRTLVNGSDNSFDVNDVYHIFNIIQCELIGGNLVGTDDVGTAIIPISPTAFTQIVRTASTSATLVSATGGIPSAIENAQAVWEFDAESVVANSHGAINRNSSFQNQIRVDQNNGSAGTTWPLGTAESPVNNIADAVAIGIREGIFIIRIVEDITVLSTDIIDGFTLEGSHLTKSEIIVQPGASTRLSQFKDCFLTGPLNGRVTIRNCTVEDLLNFEGVMSETVIDPGGIRLADNSGSPSNRISHLLNCYSGVPGQSTPEIDYNFSSHSLDIRAYTGGIKIVNKTKANSLSIDFISGQCILDGTVTAGDIVIRGIYHLEDNSGGSPGPNIVRNTNLDTIEVKIDNVQTVVDAIEVTVSNMSLVIDDLIKYQRNRSVIDPTAFTLTIYEDNGTTPLTVFDLKDSAGVASVLSIFERIPQ